MEKVQTTVRLSMDLYHELQEISRCTGLTVTSLVVVAIWHSVLKPKGLLR